LSKEPEFGLELILRDWTVIHLVEMERGDRVVTAFREFSGVGRLEPLICGRFTGDPTVSWRSPRV
jgi:hypothetical protein